MKIGLVLSGGMAKGAFQVGALEALQTLLPMKEITAISCASVGILNGYAFATHNLNGVKAMWESLCDQTKKLTIGQLLRSTLLQDCIANLYQPNTPIVPNLYCPLVDIGKRNLIYQDLSQTKEENLHNTLRAGVAMPVYNRPVNIDGVNYYDGAMIDNIPVFPLKSHDLDYIICMYFDEGIGQFENQEFNSKIIRLTFPAKNRLRQSLVFQKEGILEMMDRGYTRTLEVLAPYFEKGYNNLPHVLKTIQEHAETNPVSPRVTGDMLVTNFNKLTQRLTKRHLL